ADLGLDLQVNLAVTQDDGQEVQPGAELLELHADLAQPGGDRDGLLAAGQEAGGLPAEGDQPRLGEDLGQVLHLQGLEEAEEAGVRAKDAEEDVAAAGGADEPLPTEAGRADLGTSADGARLGDQRADGAADELVGRVLEEVEAEVPPLVADDP